MGVSRRLRFEILRRDGHTCRYCGAKAPDVALTVDHVIPTALGGTDDPTNLVTACDPCNAGKSSINPDAPVVADVEADALRWAEAMGLAAQRRRVQIAAINYEVARVDEAWKSWTIGQQEVPRKPDWRSSVERFLANDLSADDLIRLIRVAMESRARHDGTWAYFCGCCWNEITDRQEIARRLIEDGEV